LPPSILGPDPIPRFPCDVLLRDESLSRQVTEQGRCQRVVLIEVHRELVHSHVSRSQHPVDELPKGVRQLRAPGRAA